MQEDDLVAEPSSAALGRIIKALRTRKGMQRKDLAERAELSYSYLAEIENGKKKPAESIQYAIAESLGCSVSDLLLAAVQLGKRAETGAEDVEEEDDVLHASWSPQRSPETTLEPSLGIASAPGITSDSSSAALSELHQLTQSVRILARGLKAHGQSDDPIPQGELRTLMTHIAGQLTEYADRATDSIWQLMLKNLERAQERMETASPGDEAPLRTMKRLEGMMRGVRKDVAEFSARQEEIVSRAEERFFVVEEGLVKGRKTQADSETKESNISGD